MLRECSGCKFCHIFWTQVTSFSQAVSAKVEQARDAAGHIRVPGMGRDKAFTLLVIDDANTDW